MSEDWIADLQHDVSVLVSKLALANRALEDANQSIIELEAELARKTGVEQELRTMRGEFASGSKRIAQLEAALRDIQAFGDGPSSRKIARATLEG